MNRISNHGLWIRPRRFRPYLGCVFLFIGSCGGLLFASATVQTGEYTPPETIPWFAMISGLFGGLALFLFGMDQMSSALKLLAGDRLKAVLAKLSGNRISGVFTGAAVTAVIQSSSITTVLTVGFVSAGILTLTQAVGIIFGANIGTTVTAQVIAFKITDYAFLLLAIGFFVTFFKKHPRLGQGGTLAFGLGLIFIGMKIMGDSMEPLRGYPPFMGMLASVNNLIPAILASALFTALVQSSSATTGIVIVMAGQGLISLETGIALILGANIGTCFTAVLSGIGKSPEAKQAAAVHILFNLAGVILWIAFIPLLAEWVQWISPSFPELIGTERLASETPRQIANAHTTFNIVSTLVFLPFAHLFAAIARRIIPEQARPESSEVAAARKCLDPSLLEMPDLALEQVGAVLLQMGRFTENYLQSFRTVFRKPDSKRISHLAKTDDVIDRIDDLVMDYLEEIAKQPISSRNTNRLSKYVNISNEFEHIGDVLERNLVPLLATTGDRQQHLSAQTRSEIESFHDGVATFFHRILQSLENAETLSPKAIAESQEKFLKLEIQNRRSHYQRLENVPSDELDPELNLLYVDTMSYLRRIHSHLETIALELLREQ